MLFKSNISVGEIAETFLGCNLSLTIDEVFFRIIRYETAVWIEYDCGAG
jgi:hypothetical protein